MSNVIEVADELFAAIQAGDAAAVEALYADDVAVWHSVTRRSLDKDRSLAILRWIMAPGVERDYEIQERFVDGDRLAQRHVLRVTVGDHPTLELPVAIFITAQDGKITAIEEYVDQAGTDKLIELIPPG